MDPEPGLDPDPDPTPEPTPFFINFKDAKNILFSSFFSSFCLQAHHLQKKINFFAKILYYNVICWHYFSPLNTFKRKRMDPDPDAYL
jgi:hypothetical protein